MSGCAPGGPSSSPSKGAGSATAAAGLAAGSAPMHGNGPTAAPGSPTICSSAVVVAKLGRAGAKPRAGIRPNAASAAVSPSARDRALVASRLGRDRLCLLYTSDAADDM
eukprot:11762904-Alexandrium_andersonii.AAC.1